MSTDKNEATRIEAKGEAGDGSQRRLIGGARSRRKVCRFCTDEDFSLDYKNYRVLQYFVSEHGKIVPRRISGTCARHQRNLTVAVKRARNLALVGYTSPGQ